MTGRLSYSRRSTRIHPDHHTIGRRMYKSTVQSMMGLPPVVAYWIFPNLSANVAGDKSRSFALVLRPDLETHEIQHAGPVLPRRSRHHLPRGLNATMPPRNKAGTSADSLKVPPNKSPPWLMPRRAFFLAFAMQVLPAPWNAHGKEPILVRQCSRVWRSQK